MQPAITSVVEFRLVTAGASTLTLGRKIIQMHTAGLILAIFGGLFLFGSIMALAMIERDEELKKSELIDMFLLGGFISLMLNLIRSISEGIRDRKSDAFPPLIIFIIAICLLVSGFGMMSIFPS